MSDLTVARCPRLRGTSEGTLRPVLACCFRETGKGGG
jgi:hypothetical protein